MTTSGPGGVGDSSFKPIEKVDSKPESLKKPDVFKQKVRTLGDVKKILIDHLGKKKGTKMYNQFLASIAEISLLSVNQATKRAQQAAKQMRSKQ